MRPGCPRYSRGTVRFSRIIKGLELLNISNGNFLSQGEQIVALVHREDPLSGAVEITVTGHFLVKITKGAIIQPDQQPTPASGSEITVSVQ